MLCVLTPLEERRDTHTREYILFLYESLELAINLGGAFSGIPRFQGVSGWVGSAPSASVDLYFFYRCHLVEEGYQGLIRCWKLKLKLGGHGVREDPTLTVPNCLFFRRSLAPEIPFDLSE